MSDGLREIHITGFASLADVRLQPGRLTVLIGPNGSGKSSILRALRMVLLMRMGSLQRFVAEAGGAAALLHYGPKHTPEIRIHLDFADGGHRASYRAQLGFAAGDKLTYRRESVGLHDDAYGLVEQTLGVEGYSESRLRNWTARAVGAGDGHGEGIGHPDLNRAWNEAVEVVRSQIPRLAFFHFHDTSMTSALRTHARAEDDRTLRSDGSNLAAYLRRLEQSADEAESKAWRRINQFVRRIAPAVKELAPTPVHGSSVRLDWIDDQDERFGAHQLSDGTLRAIALITALAQPTAQLPKFMSIDEPELGLHPTAIHMIAELARSVSRHTQVLFATQSTAFLDHFEPSEVVVVEREDGASTLHRPDESTLASWLEDYSLSEVFDKGVIGGRP